MYLFKTNVQLGGSYTASKQSTDRYKAAFQAAADFVNASVDDIGMRHTPFPLSLPRTYPNIGLGASATQLLRNLSFTLNFDPGDEIVVSSIDHEANIAPWVDMASRQKLVLKWWTPPKSTNPKLTTENLAPLLSERTRLVTLCHSSNILGSVHDVKAIAALVHDKCPRGLVCADGVAYAPHRAVDIPALGVDFYVFSWYKVSLPFPFYPS